MARRPDVPCAGCGRLLWGGTTSRPAGERRCRDCIKALREHGTVVMYGKGRCRCQPCKDAIAEWHREYRRRYRERTGRSVSGKRRSLYGHWITADRRAALYERDGWMCWLCSEPIDRLAHANSDRAPSLDHVIPRSRHGSNEDSNLRTAHRVCNARRRDRGLCLAEA